METLKRELDLTMERSEIDIVHSVGRHVDSKPRSILEKFVSHKSKEKVKKCRTDATHKNPEDLSPGIKTILNEVNSNRFLNVDSVWMAKLSLDM